MARKVAFSRTNPYSGFVGEMTVKIFQSLLNLFRLMKNRKVMSLLNPTYQSDDIELI